MVDRRNGVRGTLYNLTSINKHKEKVYMERSAGVPTRGGSSSSSLLLMLREQQAVYLFILFI